MVDAKPLVIRYGLPGVAGLVGYFVGENPVASIIGLLIVYVLWVLILKLLGDWSRLASGLAIVVLSLPVIAVGFITTWVGAVGIVLFAHGNGRALVGASRLDR